MWHDCQPNQCFQVVFKIRILKMLQKIRIPFVFKERNYHVLNLQSCLNKFCVWAVMCSGNVFPLCQRTIIVVPYLVRINIDSFGVIITVTGKMLQKVYFSCFLKMKIGPSWAYFLNYIHVQVSNPVNQIGLQSNQVKRSRR